MTLTMFLLGALFVGLVVLVISYVRSPGGAVLVTVIAIGLAFWQWWSSDSMAMRAMRAREVTPQEAPELHGMVDRLCALADMPKPRVGIADMAVPNAFATGRSPDRAVVCVTTGILQTLDREELEAVLAHELSHVAHRDVLVMTLASSAGIAAGLLMRFAQFGGMGRSRSNNNGGAPAVLVALLVSLVVYAVSFLLLRLLSRYRELCADRAGAYLTMKPASLARALQKISGEATAIPQRDLRSAGPASALCIVPAVRGASVAALMATHPPLQKRLEQLARIDAELSRPSS
jgi:heat shock protein HtpX